MVVLSFAFCLDKDGNFGLIKSFDHGFLTVAFDYGVRRVRPTELTYI